MFAIFNQKIWEDARSPSATLENVGFSMVGLVSEDSDRPGRQAFLSVLRPSLRDDRNFETLQGWSLALPRHSGSVDACCHDPLVFVGDVFILQYIAVR